MFVIPGWNLSLKDLKTETESVQPHTRTNTETKGNNPKSKKRKRDHDVSRDSRIRPEEVGKLWAQYVEHKTPSGMTNGHTTELQAGDVKSKKKKERKGKDGRLQDHESSIKGSKKDNASNGELQEKETLKDAPTEALRPESQVTPARSLPAHENAAKEDGLAQYQKRKAKAERKRLKKETQDPSNQKSTDEPQSPKSTTSDIDNHAANAKSDQLKSRPQASFPEKKQPVSAPTSPPSKKLTPLQNLMAQKLVSARFRHLNELLYTTPSSKAANMFASDGPAFAAYHEGFQAQVAVWPSNPVDEFVQEVKTRGSVRLETQSQRWKKERKQKPGKSLKALEPNRAVDPLPRNRHTGTCTIADLGCGTAQLAAKLKPHSGTKRLNLHLLSFDLALPPSSSPVDPSTRDLVTVADVTNLRPAGVRDGSVDIAICCLSLMGTNWVRVVDECRRIVRSDGRGEVWVAEVRSRFVRGSPPLPAAGNAKRKKSGKRGKGNDDDDADDDEDENGFEDRIEEEKPLAAGKGRNRADVQTETDISGFVGVWERRGFHLKEGHGTDGTGIEWGNKMFVKMKFVKDREKDRFKDSRDQGGGQREIRFIDNDDGDDGGPEAVEERVVLEGKVLKPCVYKTR